MRDNPQDPFDETNAEEAEEVNGLDLFSTAEEDGTVARTRPARWLFAVAAIVVLVLIVVGVIMFTHRAPASETASKTVTSQIRSAHDQKSATEQAATGEVTVIWSQDVNAFAVKLDDVPAAEDEREYQVSVTNDDAGQSFESVGLIGADPSGSWHGFRGVDGVATVHVTEVAEGGENAPESEDLVQIDLKG